MTKQLHLQRCERCGYFERPPNLRGYFGYCNIIDSKEHSRDLTEEEIRIHEKCGCASFIPKPLVEPPCILWNCKIPNCQNNCTADCITYSEMKCNTCIHYDVCLMNKEVRNA